MDFIAINMERANFSLSSVCQIGLARYKNGILSQVWKSYVNPEDYFDEFQILYHGIDESMVKDAPTFPELTDLVLPQLTDTLVVCHTHFSRGSLRRVCNKYRIAIPEIQWLDTARVARRAWKQCAYRGYGLYDVCETIMGYKFQWHDALEDAKAAAQILFFAMKETGLDLDDWLKRVQQPIYPIERQYTPPIKRDGNPEGAFYGEVLVFTGALSMLRREAADLAATIGFQVAPGVTKKTTTLIVGDQDLSRLAGHEKSSKHRKAEELIKSGLPIRILKESDFEELAQLAREYE